MPHYATLIILLTLLTCTVAHSQTWKEVTPLLLRHYINDVESLGPYLGLNLEEHLVTGDKDFTLRDFLILDAGNTVYANARTDDEGNIFHRFVVMSNGELLDWISYEPDDTVHGPPNVWSITHEFQDLSTWSMLDVIGIDTQKYAPSQQRMFATFDNKVIHFGEQKGPLVTLNNGTRWYRSTLNDIIYAPVEGVMPLITGYLDRGETITLSHGLLDGDTAVKEVAALVEIDKFSGVQTSRVDGLAGNYVYGCTRTLFGKLVALSAQRDNVTDQIRAIALSAYDPNTLQWQLYLALELQGATWPVDVAFDQNGSAYVIAGSIDSLYIVDADAHSIRSLPLPAIASERELVAVCVHDSSLYVATGSKLFVWDMPVTSVANSEWNCEHRNVVKYDVLGREVIGRNTVGPYYEICSCGYLRSLIN